MHLYLRILSNTIERTNVTTLIQKELVVELVNYKALDLSNFNTCSSVTKS